MENISLDVTIDEIIQELDEKNLLYLTSGKIKELNNNALQKLYLSRDDLLHYHKILKEYRHVDEVDEIKIGGYIRWFNLNKIENLKLTSGGFIVDMQNWNGDILILCKNKYNKRFSLMLNNCILFQKISLQEKILIKIIDYASK